MNDQLVSKPDDRFKQIDTLRAGQGIDIMSRGYNFHTQDLQGDTTCQLPDAVLEIVQMGYSYLVPPGIVCGC